jgi:hypothetical protein
VVEHEAPTPGVIAGAFLIVVAAALVGRAPRADGDRPSGKSNGDVPR